MLKMFTTNFSYKKQKLNVAWSRAVVCQYPNNIFPCIQLYKTIYFTDTCAELCRNRCMQCTVQISKQESDSLTVNPRMSGISYFLYEHTYCTTTPTTSSLHAQIYVAFHRKHTSSNQQLTYTNTYTHTQKVTHTISQVLIHCSLVHSLLGLLY